MEKRRKEAVRRHKIREKSPFFPFTFLVLAVVKAAGWMLRVPPASAAPPGLCSPSPCPSWALSHTHGHMGRMKVVPGTLRGRYLEPVRILLTSGSPGEPNRADIHRIGALHPTLVIPAVLIRCVLPKAWERPRTGGIFFKNRVLTHPAKFGLQGRGEPPALLLFIQVIAFPALRVPSPAPPALRFDP